MTTVRSISDLPELYSQYAEYRLEILEERVRVQLKVMRKLKQANRRFDTAAIKAFISEQEEFLAAMNREIVDEDKVTVGFTDDSHLFSADLKLQFKKKARTSPQEGLV